MQPTALAAAREIVASASFGPVCFALGRPTVRAPLAVPELRLADKSAAALAELVPLLLCGEESAALAFGGRGTRAALGVAAGATLERIRREEVVHGLLLQRLQAALPPAPLEAALRTRMRRFFVTLAGPQPGRYFARIAGLDSAVCVLLGALRRKGSPLMADATVAAALARIHRDEGTHVDAARRIALEYVSPVTALDDATETRCRLVPLLRERAAAFDALGVDPDRLFARLATVSAGIFA
jgi:demethoxyubiquinone hydroxylase (CLK1/Coq7/Cat5 family)